MTVRYLLCSLLLVVWSAPQAATIVFDPGSTASLRIVNRIEGLVIDRPEIAGTYDVIFSSASYSSIQAAGGFPIYDLAVGDRAAVADAVIGLIITELNTTDANRIGTATGTPGALNAGVGYLPYADTQGGASVVADTARFTTGPWRTDITAANISKSTGAGGFVFISLTPVPLPASGLLLVTGLGAVVVRVYRRRLATG